MAELQEATAMVPSVGLEGQVGEPAQKAVMEVRQQLGMRRKARRC